MDLVFNLEKKIHKGENLDFEEALELSKVEDVESLYKAADRIRKNFCGERADLCSIMNAKSGRCSENCKYCAQSAHYTTGIKEYGLISKEEALELGLENERLGVHRFSLVTSGKGLVGEEFKKTVEIYKYMKRNLNISLCASHGIISYEQLVSLKEAGVTMYHHNLETSRRYYPYICSTHSYDHRIETIEAAKKAGHEICSGGIIGMGETMEDRISMALDLRKLGVRSVPVNVLNPIPGTPLGDAKPLKQDEILRTIAVFRFILPNAFVRFAGGRSQLSDCGAKGFRSGANAALVGNLLTTIGNRVDEDKEMILSLGYDI